MGIRFDKFTWVVILVVLLLLVAAVVTVNRSQGEPAELAYRTDDDPATPVWNAFVAFQRGDISTARAQYSSRLLDEQRRNGFDPFTGRGYMDDRTAQRLRIAGVELDPADPDRAYVTITIDRYYPGGLFGGGSTSSSRRTLQVVREEGAWKLDTDEYFY
ncbi:MAG: hypothetical protein DCC55_06820 [Chloroflexi bacterium]|nr:MAG: hypothetical protein DCC55_06820 [Chloroflexota bacterium]